MNPRVPITATGLDESHRRVPVFGKTSGERTTGGPGANDDVIVFQSFPVQVVINPLIKNKTMSLIKMKALFRMDWVKERA